MPTLPRAPAPTLAVETLAHGPFDLHSEASERGTVILFYRGLHCPICAGQLKQAESQVDEFARRGYGFIAISGDGRDRAQAMAEKVEASRMRIGYGLDMTTARAWGLYVSSGRGATSAGVEEPALFNEPGLFVVDRDGRTYYASVQSMPFARPSLRELVSALDFAIEKDYPARGEVAEAA